MYFLLKEYLIAEKRYTGSTFPISFNSVLVHTVFLKKNYFEELIEMIHFQKVHFFSFFFFFGGWIFLDSNSMHGWFPGQHREHS